jgi:DNA-binding MarR family transcriptional regulator
MSRTPPRRRTRERILEDLARVGRENSDATVLFHAAIADRLSLHPTDYKALGILQRAGALSAGDLARRTGLAAASVTDLVDRLETRGFVRRVRGSTDRRRVLVEPVADRLPGAHELFASTRRSLSRLFARYADRDLEVIADFLHRNAERLRRETDMLERGH